MNYEQIKRAIAFYFSLTLFFTLLPIVLSYSLGYKIDYHEFKIYKTGIIYLKSQPSGASIYLNGKMLPDVTPARIEELKPGEYRVELKRDGFYPWQKEMVVRPNMVTRADDIILFPLTQEMKRICNYEVSDFTISDKNYIYYMTNIGFFRSDMDGTSIKKLSLHSNWPRDIIGRRFSPDGSKILYFNNSSIWVIYLNPDKKLMKNGEDVKVEELLRSPIPVMDVYWYSESKHIVFVTDKDISAVELNGEGERNIVMLYRFNSKPQGIYYDTTNDSLYFTDYRKDRGAREGNYLYRLDLRQRFFDVLMQRFKKELEVSYEKRQDL